MTADISPGRQRPQAPTNAALGRAIRRLRRERGVTIEALAFDADLHPTYLSGIERGVRNPTWTKLTALAQALNITMPEMTNEAEHDICPACGGTHPQVAPPSSQ